MRKMTLTGYELADTPSKQAMGIMFRKRATRPMLFTFRHPGRIGIHSFFCPEFDAVFLDRNKRVTETYEDVASNRIITPRRSAAYLIEFPPGTVSRKGIRKGTVVSWR